MAVELNRLMKRVKHMDITLVAGEPGLSNLVSWVHMIETKEASQFLEGGEIAFTTGIGLNRGLSILDLVENVCTNHAAGIVLNTGPFLESIPQEVIAYGNEHHFPIFSVPWKIHIAEIMRIFSSMITYSEQETIQISSAFKNAISFPTQEELYSVPLSQHGFESDWTYYVTVIQVHTTKQDTISVKRLDRILQDTIHHMEHLKYKKFAIFCNSKQLIAVTGNYSEEKINAFTSELSAFLSYYLPKTEQHYISIGKCTKSIRCLHKSYHQALLIQKFMHKNTDSANLLAYSNMGIYKLLLGVEDPDILYEYYEKTVLPLIEYDERNDSELATVLWIYLRHNGSVKETADELFVHRNTVNYKLNRVSEILNVNLSNLDTRLQLTLGFMLQDML